MRPSLALRLSTFACVVSCTDPVDARGGVRGLLFDGVPYVQDRAGSYFAIDTGSPRTLVAAAPGDLQGSALTEATLPEWDLGALDAGDRPVVIAERSLLLFRFERPLEPFGGVLGQDLLNEIPFALDLQGGRFVVGSGYSLPTYVSGAAVPVGVEILGDGSGCLAEDACFRYDANRLVLPVDVEGVESLAVIDTGRTHTALASSLFGRLPGERAILELNSAAEAGARRTLSRATMRVGSASVERPIVSVFEDEAFFVKLQIESGRPVEVLLGQGFLSEFMLEVDAPAKVVSLHPYVRPTGLFDGALVGIGARFGEGDDCLPVVDVYPEHSAHAQGLRVGDCIEAVDEAEADQVGTDAVWERLTSRSVGEELALQWLRDGKSHEASVTVEDLLPRF